MKDYLPYDEQKTLEAICRFHSIEDPDLIKHLATLMNWVRQDEAAKSRLNRDGKPPFLLSLLSSMGIYGGAALEKPREGAST